MYNVNLRADSYGSLGLSYGGPSVVLYGWLFVSAMSCAVAACMAELLSAFPTAGERGSCGHGTLSVALALAVIIICMLFGTHRWHVLLGVHLGTPKVSQSDSKHGSQSYSQSDGWSSSLPEHNPASVSCSGCGA